MKHVFISYLHKDEIYLKRLVSDLKQYGAAVWTDRDNIKPGQKWKTSIKEAIQNGNFFIACFSQNYSNNDKSYMNEEITLAVDELRKFPSDRTWFIPIKFSECPIPNRNIGGGETLRDIQYVNLYENWDEGIRGILDIINPIPSDIQNLNYALMTEDPSVRREALKSLSKYNHPEVVRILHEVIKDMDIELRLQATIALGELKDPVATVALMDAADDTEFSVRKHAVEAIENLHDAEEVYEATLSSLSRFSEISPDPYNALISYYDKIKQVLSVRPFHTLLNRVVKNMEVIVGSKITETQKVEKIKKMVKELTGNRFNINAKVADNARAFLSDYESILLYGYNSLVLHSLSVLPDDIKENTPIYIGECRGKTVFTKINEIIYNDGINYAEKVLGFGFQNVHIIPDISASNLMARGLIQKIIFGANGIDINSGQVGNTCGHLAIADIAMNYSVPVYVLTETGKFGKLVWSTELERSINWLPNNYEEIEDLKKLKMTNPREDVIDPQKIAMLITEEGAFPPVNIPEKIKRKFS